MTDLEIIREIEKELNLSLGKFDKMKWEGRGYTFNPKGQVTGLGIEGCEIGNLNLRKS
jgi:hypothetical protein